MKKSPHTTAALFAGTLLLALLGPAGSARAQVDGPHAELGVGLGRAWFETWLGIENGTAWSTRLGYHPRATWGLELQWDHVSSSATDSSGSSSSTFDFIAVGGRWEFLPFRTVSPFVTASVGYARLGLPEEALQSLGLGLGIGINARFAESWSMYVELRDDMASFRSSLTHQVIATLGLRFAFGSTSDSDGDGVSDSRDFCPDTPHGAVVDERGCPSDADGDGVFEGLDRCPGTPAGTPVDEDGCPLHSSSLPGGG